MVAAVHLHHEAQTVKQRPHHETKRRQLMMRESVALHHGERETVQQPRLAAVYFKGLLGRPLPKSSVILHSPRNREVSSCSPTTLS
jgi:hypothetical protein